MNINIPKRHKRSMSEAEVCVIAEITLNFELLINNFKRYVIDRM